MIKAKPYLTLEGCAKRCNFESYHSKTHDFWPVRFIDGARDPNPFQDAVAKAKRYTWRIEKVSRKAKRA